MAGGVMAGFVQIVEYTTSRFDEVRSLGEGYREQRRGAGPVRVTITKDRDRPNTYLTIAEFESYDAAMANSNSPETQQFAEQMAKLVDGPPIFRNLDIEVSNVG
jgi:quinol monooxygenase YgiN